MTGITSDSSAEAKEPDRLEVALAAVMTARPSQPVAPPLAAPGRLPFGQLSPPVFERLVAEVVLYVDGLGRVRIYGRSGQGQEGLDLLGGPVGARSVYQVRRIKRLTASRLRTAVEDYAGAPAKAGRRPERRFDASRFVLAVACDVDEDDTAVEQELDLLQQEYAGDLEIVLYDGGELSRRLRDRGSLVAGIFGRAWAEAFCGWTPVIAPIEPEARLLLNDPVTILGFGNVLRQADEQREQHPLAAATVYHSVADVLDEAGMPSSADPVRRRHCAALEAGGQVNDALRSGMTFLLRRYDHDVDDTEIGVVVQRLAEQAGDADRAAGLVAGYLSPSMATPNVAPEQVLTAIDVLIGSGHEFALPLAVRVAERVIAQDHDEIDTQALQGLLGGLFDLRADDATRVRLQCAHADLAVRNGADPAEAFSTVLAASRAARFAEGPAALAQRRAAHALAGCDRTGEARDLYAASVVFSSHAGLGGDTRDALRSITYLATPFTDASDWAERARDVSTRDRLLPGSDQAAMATLEHLVEDKIPQALRRAWQWVRHERVAGALADEVVARRRLGAILERAEEHGAAVEEFVRAGHRAGAARAAAASPTDVTVVRFLTDHNPDAVRSAAAAVIAAQADLVPDEAVDDLVARLLYVVEEGPPVTFAGPVRVQYALRALAALGSRLTAEHADRLIRHLQPVVPREANRYRFTDDEMVSALAVLTRRTDLRSRVLAGQLLVDAATLFQVQRATTALQRLPRQDELVGPLAAAVEEGNADAAEVLATWDVWVDPMGAPLRAAADRLLAVPVGRPRDSYGEGHVGEHVGLLLAAALGRPGAGGDAELAELRDAIFDHLLAWAGDRHDIAVSRRSAVRGLLSLADRLSPEHRGRACAALLGEYDTPLRHPGDVMERESMRPLSTFRMNTRGWLFPLLCLRVAATLAATRAEIEAVRTRLALAIQRVGDDPDATDLIGRAVIARQDDPPLPVGHLAAHPGAPVRRAAALCWAADPDRRTATVYSLAADPDMLVRQHTAWIVFDLLGDQDDSDPKLAAILSGLAADRSLLVRMSATGADRR